MTSLRPASGRPAAGWRTRLQRGALFVAVVWAVVGSFVLFEVAALTGFNLAMGSARFDTVTLSNATAQSTSCAGSSSGEPRQISSLTAPDVRVAIWLLGLNTGRDAVVRHAISPDAATIASLEDSARQIAGVLGVTPPDRFVPRRVAEAYRDFVTYLESSDRDTARELATRHGPAACELYKFAALWGYASLVRAALPGERSVFPAELRHHAEALALPEDLYRPLTERTPAESADEIVETSIELTDAMTAYLQSQPLTTP
jgi:hypothetical protein